MSYGKGKSKVTKKRREDNINSRDNKNNKLLADKKCIGDLNLKKRIKKSYRLAELDKKIRKTVAKYPSRAKDSLYYKDMSTSMIFGVLYYKREMNSQGEIYLCRSLVLNPYSGYLKDSNAVGDVNKIIEGKSK